MASEHEINALKERHATTLLAHRNVSGVGVERDAEGKYALVVYHSGDVDDLPTELEGYPVSYVRSGSFEKQ